MVHNDWYVTDHYWCIEFALIKEIINLQGIKWFLKGKVTVNGDFYVPPEKKKKTNKN